MDARAISDRLIGERLEANQDVKESKGVLVIAAVTLVVAAIFVTLSLAGAFSMHTSLCIYSLAGVWAVFSLLCSALACCKLSRGRSVQNRERTPEEREALAIRYVQEVKPEEVDDSGLLKYLHHTIIAKDLSAFNACVDRMLSKEMPLSTMADEMGNTVFHYIAVRGKPEMLHYLESKGVSFDDPPGYKQFYAIHYAAAFQNHSVIPAFIKMGADPDRLCKNMFSALHIAIKVNSPDVVKALVEGGCKRDIKNNQGKTAYDLLKEKLEKDPHDQIALAIAKFLTDAPTPD